jgi:hypothetical protein
VILCDFRREADFTPILPTQCEKNKTFHSCSVRTIFPTQELGIITNDGWVVTLVADRPITLGNAIVKSIIVQPKEEYEQGVASDPDAYRTTYKLNTRGELIYTHFGDEHV